MIGWRTHAPDDLTRGLFDAMRGDGVEPLEPIVNDLVGGRLVRFRARGDRPGRKNGWAVLRADGWAFGHWRLSIRRGWKAGDGSPRKHADSARFRREQAAARQREARERLIRQGATSEAACALWAAARDAAAAHPYLTAKRMAPDGLRVSGPWLLVPMLDLRTGELANVQRIGPNGAKRFQPGARVSGLAWGRGEPGDTIALCEGVATAAAVHAATGLCAVAAMSKAELAGSALALRQRWPSVRLIAGADRDTDGGGEEAARKAMRAVGGIVALPPRSPGWDRPAWDYADLWLAPGGAALIRDAFDFGGGA